MFSPQTLNISYARKVLEHLLAHPEEHNQCTFGALTPCGTQACIAGTAVLMHPDVTVTWDSDGIMNLVSVAGHKLPADDAAAELLGLDLWDANNLFYTMDNIAALQLFNNFIIEAEAVQAVTV